MKTILLILFLSGISHGQFDIQSQWDNDFMTSNWEPDTVYEYDECTHQPVPLWEIKTYIVGMECEKIEAGNGYYIIFTNKYESVFIDKFNYKR